MSVSIAQPHRSRVLGSPWPGVHGTEIASGRRFGRHWHSTFGVGLLLGGAQRSASGRGRVDAFAGELITNNPGEVHDGEPLGAPSRHWRMLVLEPEALGAFAGVDPQSVAFTRPVFADAALARGLSALFARWDAARETDADADALAWRAAEEALVRVVATLACRHATARTDPESTSAADDPLLRDARERLADDAADPPSLAALAASLGLSRWQLLRRFERAFGLTPHAWLQQQRGERARRLIRDGAPLAEAAADCGFADQSHLNRVFVRQFGFTPGAWRRARPRSASPPHSRGSCAASVSGADT